METFQGNVEDWAAAHQNRVAQLEAIVARQQMEIQQVALKIPAPPSPKDASMGSPSVAVSTPPLPPTPAPLEIRAPQPQRAVRPPAVPPTPPVAPTQNTTGAWGTMPRPYVPYVPAGQSSLPPNFPPRTGATPPMQGQPPPPPPPRRPLPPAAGNPPPSPPGPPAYFTTEEVGEIIASAWAARQQQQPRPAQINTSPARGYRGCPICRHQRRMLSTAKLAVS